MKKEFEWKNARVHIIKKKKKSSLSDIHEWYIYLFSLTFYFLTCSCYLLDYYGTHWLLVVETVNESESNPSSPILASLTRHFTNILNTLMNALRKELMNQRDRIPHHGISSQNENIFEIEEKRSIIFHEERRRYKDYD